ncbi:NUDIX pyrophosphatase [Planctomycetota bacterium]|nr:NUDIX pyrophosphatase [Planctomycetota bacterium]
MPRAPYQILVIPFKRMPDSIMYAVFQRTDNYAHQFIAGGGEDTETPLQAATRELLEETNISPTESFIPLQAKSMIPASIFSNLNHNWASHIKSIPEHCFGIDITDTHRITLSSEHTTHRWLTYEQAIDRLTYKSNHNALKELDLILKK